MEKVYFVDYASTDRSGAKVKAVLGVFDTSERAIAYLRKYFKNGDDEYVRDESFTLTEHRNGDVEGHVIRFYKDNDHGLAYEKLTLRAMQLNAAFNPEDDITDVWC